MIKNLSSKFVLVFLVLVVSVIITSSCYAVELTSSQLNIVSLEDYGLNLDTVKSYISNKGSSYLDNYSGGNIAFYSASSNVINFHFFSTDSDISYFVYTNPVGMGYRTFLAYDLNGLEIATCSYIYFSYDISSGSFTGFNETLSGPPGYNFSGTTGTVNIVDCMSYDIYLNDSNGDLVYTPNRLSVDVTHVFQSDTSAKVNFVINNVPEGAYLQYSLSGVELNADLTASLQLKNPVTYTPRSKQFSC